MRAGVHTGRPAQRDIAQHIGSVLFRPRTGGRYHAHIKNTIFIELTQIRNHVGRKCSRHVGKIGQLASRIGRTVVVRYDRKLSLILLSIGVQAAVAVTAFAAQVIEHQRSIDIDIPDPTAPFRHTHHNQSNPRIHGHRARVRVGS